MGPMVPEDSFDITFTPRLFGLGFSRTSGAKKGGSRDGRGGQQAIEQEEPRIAIYRVKRYQMHQGIMWVQQCHVYHPPVITIFISGMFTIPNRWFMAFFVKPKLRHTFNMYGMCVVNGFKY